MNSEYRIVGKLDLREEFESWKDPENAFPGDPPEGWRLKRYKVFACGTAIVEFENRTGNNGPYYRWYFYRMENSGPVRTLKMRAEPNGTEVENFSYDGKTLLAVKRSLKTGEKFLATLPVPGESDPLYDELEDIPFQKRSREYFILLSGDALLFAACPKDTPLNVPDEYSEVRDSLRSSGETEIGDLFGDAEGDNDTERNSEDDTSAPLPAAETERRSGSPGGEGSAMEKLNALVGLSDVKRQIRKIVALARLRREMAAEGKQTEPLNLNMVFSGNPGTAKTTVARLLAGILKENGILSGGGLVETGRADLVAKYVGQTAIKVRNVFREARGGLLFIDEAYSLTDGYEGGYGDEAIATIVQEMENNRDDLVVVFAGYPDKMREFISRNPGLRSRVPVEVAFPDYSACELLEIAKLEAARRGFALRPDAPETILAICGTARKNSEFGNGRFSRNLVEQAELSYALRSVETSISPEAKYVLCPEDFTLPDCFRAPEPEPVAVRIGFAA